MTDTGRLIPRRRDMHPVPYDPEYKTSVTRSPNLPLLSLESTRRRRPARASDTA